MDRLTPATSGPAGASEVEQGAALPGYYGNLLQRRSIRERCDNYSKFTLAGQLGSLLPSNAAILAHSLTNAVRVEARARTSWGDGLVTESGRVIVIGALLATVGAAGVHAQAVLGDPKDAPRIFAANCSACHKSPRGLAKSGQVAGFLRQHYTTGPEMSAAMAAYLVAAGSAPPEKKGPAAADATAAKTKSRKAEQLAAQHQGADAGEAIQHRTLRGKQRQAKEHEEPAAAPHVTPAPQQPAEETKQTAALGPAAATPVPAPAASAAEPPVVLDLPLPSLPEGPPPDLVQSFFSSSPVP
jgi:hypothetical protein